MNACSGPPSPKKCQWGKRNTKRAKPTHKAGKNSVRDLNKEIYKSLSHWHRQIFLTFLTKWEEPSRWSLPSAKACATSNSCARKTKKSSCEKRQPRESKINSTSDPFQVCTPTWLCCYQSCWQMNKLSCSSTTELDFYTLRETSKKMGKAVQTVMTSLSQMQGQKLWLRS